MDEEKKIIRSAIIGVVLICLGCAIAGFGLGICIHANLRASGSVGQEPARTEQVNRELADGLRREQDRNREALELIERIGERAQRTDNEIESLRRSNRTTGGLLQDLRKEIDILANEHADLIRELNSWRLSAVGD